MSKDNEWSYANYESGKTVEEFSSMAQSEFTRLVERLKREKRREQLLYLRSLPRAERKALKAKYGIK